MLLMGADKSFQIHQPIATIATNKISPSNVLSPLNNLSLDLVLEKSHGKQDHPHYHHKSIW